MKVILYEISIFMVIKKMFYYVIFKNMMNRIINMYCYKDKLELEHA